MAFLTLRLASQPLRRLRLRRMVAACGSRPFGATLALASALVIGVPAAQAGARVGHPAPDFTLPDWQQRPLALATLRGTIVVVDFWASWCIPCAPMLPALDALARRDPGRVRVLAIDVDQSHATGDAFLREHVADPALTALRDPDGAVLARYGAPGMPAVYVVDRDGVIRFVDTGYSPESFEALDRAVAEALALGE